MRYAIVDNSTLTAVQRLLGEIEVKNTLSLDGDIAAFETLIQTILFYDTVFYVDDYKEEFRAERRKTFSYLVPIPSGTVPYNELSTAATAAVDGIILKVQGGKIDSNEIGKFLELLKMHTTFTWDMRSSDWFLTMKMLSGTGGIDIEKYSILNDMIFLELTANRETRAPKPPPSPYNFFGSDGAKVQSVARDGNVKYEVSTQLKAFAASLNWLAMRTTFYTFFSYHYDADAVLHPIRSAFQFSLAGRLGLKNGQFTPILRRLSDETVQVVRDITNTSDPVVAEMNIPLFSAWLVGNSGNPRTAIEAAFDLRNEKPFSEARQRLSDLEQASKEPSKRNFVKEANRLVAEVRKAGDTLRQLYAVETKNGISISPMISVFNVLGKLKGLPSLPNLPIKVSLPDKVMEIGIRGSFKGVCRSVVQDLIAVGRLGEYHERLTSMVRFSSEEPMEILAKTEDIRFLGRESHWKQPM